MTRRVTKTHSTDAHVETKERLRTGAERISGRHRGGTAKPADPHPVPASAPAPRTRKSAPTTSKM
jgi:hypothetical protein